MTNDEYQEWGRQHWTDREYVTNVTHALMGLQTETAELTDLFKKGWYTPDRAPIWDAEDVKNELGDVLYYMMRLADEHDVTLDEIIEYNVIKLDRRYGDT